MAPAGGVFARASAAQRAQRLTDVTWWPVELPLASALRHASADTSALTSAIVRVVADGRVGHAEVRTNGAYATGEDAAVVDAALRSVVGAPVTVGETTDGLLRASRLAAMAVDVAAWDALSRGAGAPLHRVLGGAGTTRRVSTHGAVAFGSVADATRLAARYVAAGLRRVKVRIGGDPADDLARVGAVRGVVGPDVEIVVDANAGWGVDDAVSALDPLGAMGVTWFEQPVTGLEALLAVTTAARARRGAGSGSPRIRADESVADAAGVARLAAGSVVDGVHLKVEKAGTVARLAEAVAGARTAGLGVAVGQMDQGRLGCAATAHVASGLGVDEVEAWGFAHVSRDVAGPLELDDGAIVLPDRPGLGVELTAPPTTEGQE